MFKLIEISTYTPTADDTWKHPTEHPSNQDHLDVEGLRCQQNFSKETWNSQGFWTIAGPVSPTRCFTLIWLSLALKNTWVFPYHTLSFKMTGMCLDQSIWAPTPVEFFSETQTKMANSLLLLAHSNNPFSHSIDQVGISACRIKCSIKEVFQICGFILFLRYWTQWTELCGLRLSSYQVAGIYKWTCDKTIHFIDGSHTVESAYGLFNSNHHWRV